MSDVESQANLGHAARELDVWNGPRKVQWNVDTVPGHDGCGRNRNRPADEIGERYATLLTVAGPAPAPQATLLTLKTVISGLDAVLRLPLNNVPPSGAVMQIETDSEVGPVAVTMSVTSRSLP